jgi:hypothetical protein
MCRTLRAGVRPLVAFGSVMLLYPKGIEQKKRNKCEQRCSWRHNKLPAVPLRS